MGTRFVASTECNTLEDYKMAIVNASEEDIVSTTRLTGGPVSVIKSEGFRKDNSWLFKKLLERGNLILPNDDQSYENSSLKDVLLKNSGYSRYEISNYSLPGHHSRHNRVYWKGSGWWGFGQGSTSSPWGEKITRPKISKDYKNWVTNQSESELEPSLINEKNQYKELDEKIMLGLRLKEGIDIKELFNEQKWNKKKVEINYKKLLI